MMNGASRALGVVTVGIAIGATLLARGQTTPGVRRAVYFTAVNQQGAYIADLTAADLSVKDGGRDQSVLSVEPSHTRVKIALAIDEALSPDDFVRRAALGFVERAQASADIALYLVGSGTAKLVDYTSNPQLFREPLNGIPRRTQGGGNLVEALFQIAKDQRLLEGRRAIVVLTTEIPQRTSVTANGVLDQLRDAVTVLHAATLVGPASTIDAPTPEMAHLETMDEVERDRVLNDGPKQSGGLRLSLLRLDAFPAALDRIRAELLHEYVVTYVLPVGVKSDGRLSITPRRKGITVRAPNRLPRTQ